MGDILQSLVLTFVPLFIVIDALGNLPFVISLSEGMAAKERRRMIHVATLTAAVVGLVFLFFGQFILQLLGISVGSSLRCPHLFWPEHAAHLGHLPLERLYRPPHGEGWAQGDIEGVQPAAGGHSGEYDYQWAWPGWYNLRARAMPGRPGPGSRARIGWGTYVTGERT